MPPIKEGMVLKNDNAIHIAFVLFLFLIFPAFADSGSSGNYRMDVDASAYAEMGNSSSYKVEAASGLSAEKYNSSLYSIVLGFFTPTSGLRQSNTTSARLDFTNQIKTGNQTLSVIVTDNLGSLVAGAAVNGTIVEPDGVKTAVNFTETSLGNYTNNFALSKIGDYDVSVSVSKAGYADISSSKSIYAGLVKLSNFTSEAQVFQGSSISFRYTTRNTGNVNSTIVPRLSIYGPSGALAFAKSGISQKISGNETISLLQHNIMTWSVGSAASGTYSASGNILFTDPDGNEAVTPNRTVSFTVHKAPDLPAPSGGVVRRIVDETEFAEMIERVPGGALYFTNIPVLIEMSQGEQAVESMILFNSMGDTADLAVTADGIPPEWFFIPDSSFSVEAASGKDVTLVLNIPPYALPGNYQVKVHFEGKDISRDFFFILRVDAPEQAVRTDSVVSKRAEIKEAKQETHFMIKVGNKEKQLESLTVVERIDKSVAGNVNEVVFSMPPSRIIEADPVVEFTFSDLQPFEERNVTYYVRKVVNTTAPFAFSSFEQISTIERIKEIKEGLDSGQVGLLVIIALIAVATVILYARRKSRVREEVKEVEKIVVRVEK